jgi:adenylate cyclase
MSRKFRRAFLSMLVTAFFLLPATRMVEIPLLTKLENIAYDQRLLFNMPGGVDERIVILNIDEKSLAVEGHWPWSRDRLAELIDIVFDHYRISVLGFDVVFVERDTSSGIDVLDRLAATELSEHEAFLDEFTQLRPELELDRRFAESLVGRNVVLGFFTNARTGLDTKVGSLPKPVFTDSRIREALQGKRIPFLSAPGYGGNLAELQAAALTAGFFDNPVVDTDGVFRRAPLLLQYGDGVYEALSLAMARVILGMPPVNLDIGEGYRDDQLELGLEWISIDSFRIPVDAQGTALVPYRGPQGSFPYYSIVDVLNRKVERRVLENAIVLVGTTAAGLMDMRSTPVQNVYPGVEIHANLIASILDQTMKEHPHYIIGLEFIVLLAIGLLITFLMPRFSPIAGTLFCLLLLVSVIVLNFYLWRTQNLVTNLASPVMLIAALYLYHMSYGYFVESRGKRELGRMFGHYIPPELVDEMSETLSEYGLHGESREMTVLFSDVRDFTSISEGLDPTELTALMNELLTPLTRVIQRRRGTIDKYMGDAVMAFWGAPLADLDHASNAVGAALGMVNTLRENSDVFIERGWPQMRMGVGVSTGVMNVGNMGSEFRMAYTVMGDSVNLGARLEGLTKRYGVSILVSEWTRAQAPSYTYREIDWVRVKGRDEPVAIFEPLDTQTDEEFVLELDRYHAALEYYRGRRWAEALRIVTELSELHPETTLYRVYQERIQYYMINPPPASWDGVATFTVK